MQQQQQQQQQHKKASAEQHVGLGSTVLIDVPYHGAKFALLYTLWCKLDPWNHQ